MIDKNEGIFETANGHSVPKGDVNMDNVEIFGWSTINRLPVFGSESPLPTAKMVIEGFAAESFVRISGVAPGGVRRCGVITVWNRFAIFAHRPLPQVFVVVGTLLHHGLDGSVCIRECRPR